jgi:hypothetical protein
MVWRLCFSCEILKFRRKRHHGDKCEPSPLGLITFFTISILHNFCFVSVLQLLISHHIRVLDFPIKMNAIPSCFSRNTRYALKHRVTMSSTASEQGSSGGGHYFLAQLRAANPDPAMKALPPLPPSNSVPLMAKGSTYAAPPPVASTNGYWLSRLRDAELMAQKGLLPQRNTNEARRQLSVDVHQAEVLPVEGLVRTIAI